MGKIRFLAIALLVIGIAFFTSWLLRTLGETPLVKTDGINREPDYFFNDFVATARNLQGDITYRLEAKRLQHLPYNRSMHLEKPYIELFHNKTKPWQTWAEQGVFYEKRRLVTLTGKVRIHRAADEVNQPVTLLTESLTLDMRDKIAKTSAEVQITSGEDILYATGMLVDLETGRVELHSKVQGKYEVPKQK